MFQYYPGKMIGHHKILIENLNSNLETLLNLVQTKEKTINHDFNSS